MPKYGVTSQKEDELLARMLACNLREQDIEEGFIRGGGPGGQKVNKTASCVHLKHTPTGLEVKMQKARSQALNRFYARRRLCELLEEKQQGAQSPQALRILKLRKQKARRGRRARSALETVAISKSEEEE